MKAREIYIKNITLPRIIVLSHFYRQGSIFSEFTTASDCRQILWIWKTFYGVKVFLQKKTQKYITGGGPISPTKIAEFDNSAKKTYAI